MKFQDRNAFLLSEPALWRDIAGKGGTAVQIGDLLTLLISLLAPSLPALIYSARQKPRWPYFLATFLGAVAFFFFVAILYYRVIFGSGPPFENLFEAFLMAYVGGVVGAYTGPAVVACFLGPADRRAAARRGMGIGLGAGALLTFLVMAWWDGWLSHGRFEDPALWARVLAGGVLAAAVGGLIGPYARESWKRHAAARRR